MAEQAPCPRCRHANPPENRFCGWCGASLGAGGDLVARREGNPTVMGHALPVKPGPVGKALAVGLVTLVLKAGCPGCAAGPQQETGHLRRPP